MLVRWIGYFLRRDCVCQAPRILIIRKAFSDFWRFVSLVYLHSLSSSCSLMVIIDVHCETGVLDGYFVTSFPRVLGAID